MNDADASWGRQLFKNLEANEKMFGKEGKRVRKRAGFWTEVMYGRVSRVRLG